MRKLHTSFNVKIIFLRLIGCVLLITACSKETVSRSDRYFLGEWTLSGGLLSTPNSIPTTVTFQESGKVIFDTHILVSPGQGTQKLTQDWRYDQASRALVLNQGQDVYGLLEQLPARFTVTHRASGEGLTFSRL